MRSWLLLTCLIEALTSGIRPDSSEPDLRILISCSERCSAIKLNKLHWESSAIHRFKKKWQSLRRGSLHRNRLATPRCVVHYLLHRLLCGWQQGEREEGDPEIAESSIAESLRTLGLGCWDLPTSMDLGWGWTGEEGSSEAFRYIIHRSRLHITNCFGGHFVTFYNAPNSSLWYKISFSLIRAP